MVNDISLLLKGNKNSWIRLLSAYKGYLYLATVYKRPADNSKGGIMSKWVVKLLISHDLIALRRCWVACEKDD